MPADPHVDDQASLCRDLDALKQLCSSASVALSEDVSGVISLELQDVNAITECHSVVTAKAEVLERASVVEKTSAVSLSG